MFKIGDKAKGFKFDSNTDSVHYDNDMDNYVGLVGEVVESWKDSFVILFPDQLEWMYPASLWDLAKVEETAVSDKVSFNVGEDVSFHIGDRVKFKKSSIDSGMIDAKEGDVFTVKESYKRTVTLEELQGCYHVTHFEHVEEEVMNNTEEQEIGWEVGQEVFCLLRGKGIVHQIYNTGMDWSEGVDVYFMNHGIIRFKFDGTIATGFNRSLFFSKPKIEAEKFPPKKPFTPTLKEGDVILAKDYRGFRVIRVSSEDEHFVYNEDGTGFGKSGWEFRTLGEEIIFN